jgi:exopolysaccharide production protein ExoZ
MASTQSIDSGAPGAPSTVENIQALRGIAALLVLWAHLKFPVAALSPGSERISWINTAHGAIGVDLFFVISGYVISMTACKRHHRPLDFFLARIARVAPLYLAVFPLAFLHKAYVSWPAIPWRSAWNGLFYLPIFDWNDYTLPPLAVGWTLSFEMWFYVAFALLLNVWKPTKVALLLPLLFFAGAGAMTLYHGAWYLPRFLFHPFVLEFAFGCIVFQTQNAVKAVASWLLLAGGLFYMLVFSRHTGFLGWHVDLLSQHMDWAWERVLLWGFPSALVAAGLVGLERNSHLVLPRALVWLGGISYSLYLTHWFSVMIFAALGKKLGLHDLAAVMVVVVISTLVVAWLCWRWVEQPLTKRAQAWAKGIAQTQVQPGDARRNLASVRDAS